MTVSMRVMSAGDGYRYLLASVAAGDGDRSLSTPLTRYYLEAGCPPGRWLGSGVGSLPPQVLTVGDVVSEAQLQLLIGQGRNPVTGEVLGRPYLQHRSVAQRVEDRALVGGEGQLRTLVAVIAQQMVCFDKDCGHAVISILIKIYGRLYCRQTSIHAAHCESLLRFEFRYLHALL